MAKNNLSLVFIPFPVMSHFVSVVETAKLLTKQNKELSITIIILKLPVDTKIDDHIKNSPESRITFIKLPQNHDPHFRDMTSMLFMESQKDVVRIEIAKIATESKLAGIVLDMFCTTMIDVGKEFGVSSYIFFTCGASVLGMMLHLQRLRDDENFDLMDLEKSETEILIPAYVHPIPISVLPYRIFSSDSSFIDLAKRFREVKGILVNTFLDFESYAISTLNGDEKIPHVYPIGPVLKADGEETGKNREKQSEIISWLNEQPNSSVVFLCFGTRGSFEEEQVKEIAFALEKSGHRFLWSLRKPPPKGSRSFTGEYENFDEVLPKGFLERTMGFGKVIGWAPQMAILSHPATGGFVSHCGWNSTLESVYCGVPMAVWPFFAEQQMNAFLLLKDLEMAVEIQMDYKHDSGMIVSANKIEEAIRELMDLGNENREKVKMVQTSSRLALHEGGSSHQCLNRFLNELIEES